MHHFSHTQTVYSALCEGIPLGKKFVAEIYVISCSVCIFSHAAMVLFEGCMCGARCVAMEGTCSTCGTGTARTHTAQLAVDTTASMYLWPANLSLDRTVFDLLIQCPDEIQHRVCS